MRNLDDTDLQILRLLLEDARRPYSEIADRVGVSPPTVSDRVDRLQKLGVIEQFTLDVDRSKLTDGVSVLIDLKLEPAADHRIPERLAATGQVERVYQTAEARLLVEATVDQSEIRPMLEEAIDMDSVDEFEVNLLASETWEPQLSSPGLRMEYDDESDVSATAVDPS